ncbi:YfgM family protein [Modicisalibacter luteus]|uniref:Ancillary SecYEG translocon subunit n=1 Tax=Modicisalibacter luteus TaxID=453962 RepID=A0ABV7LZH6_9GAMM|nr:tetratricopeptide repeat protein [Halomonas lutea]GHB10969.1 hypothetical protein GCM10007159_36510 [Halomonas lutea]
MAELQTEEEQLDAIKRWWKANGTSLIAGVVIAAAGVFGWKAWQSYQANQAEAASMRYQQLLSLAGQDELDADMMAQAQQLIGEVKDEHGDTLYADLATLLQARLAITDNDHAAAMEALQGLIDTTQRPYLQGLARLRLARVQLADGNPDTALKTLEAGVPDALAAQLANTRGDIFVALDREADAREAYRNALRLAQEGGQPVPGVQLKLDNLGAEDAML